MSRKASAKFWEQQQSLDQAEVEATSSHEADLGQQLQHQQPPLTVNCTTTTSPADPDLAWLNVNPTTTANNMRYAANFSALEVKSNT